MTAGAGARPAGSDVAVEGVPIHLERLGAGRPVCLIHGASGNLNDMTFRLGPALAERFEVIAVDRPGHGRSGLPAGGGVSIQPSGRTAARRARPDRASSVRSSSATATAARSRSPGPSTRRNSISGLVLLAAPSQVWRRGLGIDQRSAREPAGGSADRPGDPRACHAGRRATGRSHSVFAPQTAAGGLSRASRPGSDPSAREPARECASARRAEG